MHVHSIYWYRSNKSNYTFRIYDHITVLPLVNGICCTDQYIESDSIFAMYKIWHWPVYEALHFFGSVVRLWPWILIRYITPHQKKQHTHVSTLHQKRKLRQFRETLTVDRRDRHSDHKWSLVACLPSFNEHANNLCRDFLQADSRLHFNGITFKRLEWTVALDLPTWHPSFLYYPFYYNTLVIIIL